MRKIIRKHMPGMNMYIGILQKYLLLRNYMGCDIVIMS
jgi:hypothetical protein